MKRLFLVLAGVVLMTAIGFGESGGISYFSARPDGDGVTVEFKSGNEAGISSYTIERSQLSTNAFDELSTLTPVGNDSYYKYHDGHLSSMPQANAEGGMTPTADMYKYRVRINYASAVSYSETISVTRPSSGVRRTWGMIKEMFH